MRLALELAWGFAHPPDPSRHARQLQARAARSRNALTCLCVRVDAIAEGCGRTRDDTGSLRAAEHAPRAPSPHSFAKYKILNKRDIFTMEKQG